MKAQTKYMNTLLKRKDTHTLNKSEKLQKSVRKKSSSSPHNEEFDQELKDLVSSYNPDDVDVEKLIEDNILIRLENEQLRMELDRTKKSLNDLKSSKY